MYSLSCAAMGMADCAFVAKAETQEEVFSLITEHVNNAHQAKMEEISKLNPTELEEMKQGMMAKMVKE